MSLGVSGKHSAIGANLGKFGGGGGGGGAPLGTASNPADNARQLRDAGISQEGAYYINLPSVGVTQIYCAPSSGFAGGGWMLAWKCTRGSTFPFGSSYWTQTNTLNTSDMSRNDADAKYHTFN